MNRRGFLGRLLGGAAAMLGLRAAKAAEPVKIASVGANLGPALVGQGQEVFRGVVGDGVARTLSCRDIGADVEPDDIVKWSVDGLIFFLAVRSVARHCLIVAEPFKSGVGRVARGRRIKLFPPPPTGSPSAAT